MLFQTLLLICSILAVLSAFSKKRRESFISTKINAYGQDHTSIYDTLVYDSTKNKNEIDYLQPILSTSSNVLDIGCGTGHHVHALHERGVHAIGIDISPFMIAHAKKMYAHDYLHGDVMSTALFPQESFTHILCMYFTIYCMKYKEQFFKNAFHWLMPGGYLVLHVSKKWAYGPTSSFKGAFSYDKLNTHEKIVIKGKHKRVDHQVYMQSISSIIGLAKQAGFTVYSTYAYTIPYTDQYMYVFTKCDSNMLM